MAIDEIIAAVQEIPAPVYLSWAVVLASPLYVYAGRAGANLTVNIALVRAESSAAGQEIGFFAAAFKAFKNYGLSAFTKDYAAQILRD